MSGVTLAHPLGVLHNAGGEVVSLESVKVALAWRPDQRRLRRCSGGLSVLSTEGRVSSAVQVLKSYSPEHSALALTVLFELNNQLRPSSTTSVCHTHMMCTVVSRVPSPPLDPRLSTDRIYLPNQKFEASLRGDCRDPDIHVLNPLFSLPTL